jgi:hypothetical protein
MWRSAPIYEVGQLGRFDDCAQNDAPDWTTAHTSLEIIHKHGPTTQARQVRPFVYAGRSIAARAALGRKISSEILQDDQIPNHGIYPNLGAQRGSHSPSQMALMIPAEFFRRITEKVVRGITYLEDGRFIEPPHRIHFLHWTSTKSSFGSNSRLMPQ